MGHPVYSSFLDFLGRHWPPLAIVACALVLHHDLLLGAVPATGDHMIHLYRGWLMSEHLVPSGRLTGWSHLAFAGDPAGVYYPIIGDLLVAAVRAVTFGLLTWEHTYTLAFLALLVAMPLSVYAVARCATGRLSSLAASVLAMGDVGGWPQGGHYSTVHWAVWPFMLGLTLTMFSVRALAPCISKPVRQDLLRYLGVSALLGLTVLAHPMTAFFLALTHPLLLACFCVTHRAKVHPLRALWRAGLVVAAAAALSVFWVLPWAGSGDYWTMSWPAVGFGGEWFALDEMFKRFANNTLFKNFYWLTWLLGGAGFVLAFVSRRMWPIYFALLFTAAFVFAGLAHACGDGVMLRKVQIERIAALMKLIWILLAAVALDSAGRATLFAFGKLPEHWRRLRSLTVFMSVAKVVAPLAFCVSVIWSGWEENFSKILETGHLGGPIWQSVVQAENWLGQQSRGPLDRVLYQPGELCIEPTLATETCSEIYHRHMFASGPVRTGLPKLKFGYEATAIFRNLPLPQLWPSDTLLIKRLLTESVALERLHVRWIVSLAEWPKRPDIKEAKRFGSIVVYSVETGKRPPVMIEGPGTASVEAFADEAVRVRVAGAAAESRLVFPIAYYYAWHAYHDGQPTPIELAGILPDARKILISTKAANGLIELRYERPLSERAAGWTSFAAWIALLLGVAALGATRWLQSRRAA